MSQLPTSKSGAPGSDPSDADLLATRIEGRSRSIEQRVDVDAGTLLVPSQGGQGTEAREPVAAFEKRYTFRRELGRGGMGEVRLLLDHTIGREIALKVMRGERSGDPSRAIRFIREARVQGQLEHPSVVPVYELAKDHEGNLYFTMKRIRGSALNDILKGRVSPKPSQRRLLEALHRVAQTLAFAHNRGVVHRDLKPANIMLGDFGEVYVLDWGLAKILHGDEAELSEQPSESAEELGTQPISDSGTDFQTIAGDVLGTPGYMAPEQLRGSAALDGRADVYSLGTVLYEILVGQRLHQGDSIAAIAFSTMSKELAQGELPQAAPELAELCVRALSLQAEDRIDASTFAESLRSYLDGDRDLALRAKASAQHVTAAKTALEAPGTEEAQRRNAMKEVNAALAMDPDNEEARHLFYTLLTKPPEEVPAEVKEELRVARLKAKRVGLRAAALVYLSFTAMVPIVLYLGVKNWWAFAAEGIAIATCFGLTVFHLRDTEPHIPLDHLVAATLTVAVSMVLLGPFMLVPSLALANTTSYAIATYDRRTRHAVVAGGCVALILPVIVHYAGWVPSTFAVIDGEIIVRSLMFELTPTGALVFLSVVHVPTIIGAGWYIGKMKAAHAELEEASRVMAWQLAQMAPQRRDESEQPGG